MWYVFAIPAAIIAAAWAYGASKTSSKNVPISQQPSSQLPTGTGPGTPSSQTKPIVAGDLINVDIFTGQVIIPGKPSGTVVMRVLSLEVPGDQFKQMLNAAFVFPNELISLTPQNIRRAGVTPFLPVLSGSTSAPLLVTPAAQAAAQLQSATQGRTAPGPAAPGVSPEMAAILSGTSGSSTPEIATIASVAQAADDARRQALLGRVPEAEAALSVLKSPAFDLPRLGSSGTPTSQGT